MRQEDFVTLASRAVHGEDGRGMIGNNRRHLLERVAQAIKQAVDVGIAIGAKEVACGDGQAIYQDETGRIWHPHRGYWCWKTATALSRSQAALRNADAAKDAEIKRLRNKVPARALGDSELSAESTAVDEVIDGGFGEGGGSPGEWWYERADELEHERKRRDLERQVREHGSFKAAGGSDA